MPTVARVLGVLAVLVVAACGSGSSPHEPSTTTTTFPALEGGEGALLLGGSLYRFTVGRCTDGSAPGDTPQARQQFRLTGAGQVGTLPFTIAVTRYTSDTGVGGTTVTETALVTTGSGDARRGVEAKRTRVGGRWIDLAQPNADRPLIERVGATVAVGARFGPEGARVGDPDIVIGRLRARCPT